MAESESKTQPESPSTENKSGQNGSGANGAGDPQAQGQLRLLAQYVKDLSFENPSAPQSLNTAKDGPKIDVSVDVQANRRSNTEFEVQLKLSASAKKEEETVFIVELVYAGLFQMTNIPEDQLQPIVLVECPRLIFPFARRVLADATRDGGFPPLLIDPIDFVGLYQQQMAAQQQQAETPQTETKS